MKINHNPQRGGKSKATTQSAASSSSSNKKIIIISTPISAQKEKPVDESHLKKTKSYWKSLDLTALIEELAKRGQAIEPPVSEAKSVKGKVVKEKIRAITKKYLLDNYFSNLNEL